MPTVGSFLRFRPKPGTWELVAVDFADVAAGGIWDPFLNMYSTLFRELCASRIQLEMSSTEPKPMSASDVRAPSDCDVGHVTTPAAILDPQTYHVSFVQTTNGSSAMFQIPPGWGPILGSFASNGAALSNPGVSPLPLALCLSGYLRQNETSQQQQQLAFNSYFGHLGGGSCNSQADPNNCGYDLGGRLPASCVGTGLLDSSIPQQSIPLGSHQQHLPETSSIYHRLIVEDNIPGCLTYPPVPSSSSSSSLSLSSASSLLPSDVILPGASTVAAARCSESEAEVVMMMKQQPEDDENAEADSPLNPDGITPAAGIRVSPHHHHQQQQPVRREDGVLPPAPARTHEPLAESSEDEDDDDEDDGESRPRSSLGPFDRRRGSFGAGGGGEEGGGGPAAVAAADQHPAPSPMRRSSIACIPLSSKGPRGPTGSHLLHRASAAALDYEGLKVRLEKLTGPVTEGASKADRGRRTSLPVTAVNGLTGAAMGGGHALAFLDVHNEDDQTTKEPTTDAVDGASNPPQTKEGVATTQPRTPSISPSHAKEHFETDEKNPMDDLSSSNSLSSSSSSTSSSFLEKIRLQCVIEHVLQNDLRLQEIIKRHELEREYVRRRHRAQWLELEKSLTQNFGEAWKVYVDIPELSFIFASTGLNHHENFADSARQLQHHHHHQQQQQQQQQQHQQLQQQQQQQRQTRRGDEGTTSAVQGGLNAVEGPLGTIREGPIEEGSPSLAENDDEFLDGETASFYRAHRLSLAATDRSRADERRRNSEGNYEALHRKLRSGWPGGVHRGQTGDDRPKSAEEDTGEIRLSHNIANCLAKTQSIPCPGSSRLHRREVCPSSSASSTHPTGSLKAGAMADSDQRTQALSQPAHAFQYANHWLANPNLLLVQLCQQDLIRRLVAANLEAVQQMPFAGGGGGGGGGLDPGALTRTDEGLGAGETGQQRGAVLSVDPVGCDPTWKYSQNPVEEIPALATQVDRPQHPHAVPPSFQAPFVGIFPHSFPPPVSNPVASRIGWTTSFPEVGPTGFYPNPLLQNAAFNLQEIGQQILAFPWTTTTGRPNPVYSLSGPHDYGDPI